MVRKFQKYFFTFCLFPGTLKSPSSAVRCASAVVRARTMLGAQLQVSSHSIISLRTSVSRDTPNTEPSESQMIISQFQKSHQQNCCNIQYLFLVNLGCCRSICNLGTLVFLLTLIKLKVTPYLLSSSFWAISSSGKAVNSGRRVRLAPATGEAGGASAAARRCSQCRLCCPLRASPEEIGRVWLY